VLEIGIDHNIQPHQAAGAHADDGADDGAVINDVAPEDLAAIDAAPGDAAPGLAGVAVPDAIGVAAADAPPDVATADGPAGVGVPDIDPAAGYNNSNDPLVADDEPHHLPEPNLVSKHDSVLSDNSDQTSTSLSVDLNPIQADADACYRPHQHAYQLRPWQPHQYAPIFNS